MLSVHLFPQHPIGILQTENTQAKLVLPHPPSVSRLLCGQVVFPPSLPVLLVLLLPQLGPPRTTDWLSLPPILLVGGVVARVAACGGAVTLPVLVALAARRQGRQRPGEQPGGRLLAHS